MNFKIRDYRGLNIERAAVLCCFGLLICGVAVYALASRPAGVETIDANRVVGTPLDSPEALGTPPGEAKKSPPTIVERACDLMCEGKFDSAAELIEGVPTQYDSDLHKLLQLAHEYRAISEKREADRQAAYQKQLDKLAEAKKTFDANEVKVSPPADVNDANDANNVDSLTKALSIIVQACDLADAKQKEMLLAEPFVKEVFQKAIDKGSKYEAQGKWLDAYLSCYSWLQTIAPENQQYSDHADELVEKAGIVGSVQDSPCESRQQRYEKITPEMFIRAIEALHFNYVSIIDYRQMANKALQRCEMLGQVMIRTDKDAAAAVPHHEEPVLIKDKTVSRSSEPEKVLAKPEQFTAWSVSLAAIRDEIGQLPTGISKDKFIEIFKNVLDINKTTVQLPEMLLIAQYAEAALAALDPYTVMVWPRQVSDFEKTMTNEFTGIGIEISKPKGLLTVSSLLPDTPAYSSGLDAGDVIDAVDGVPTKDMSLNCAVHHITGPAGTVVKLTVRRPGEPKTREISITRGRITVPTLRGWQRTDEGNWLYMLDNQNKIGYARITSFSSTTATGFEEVLKQLESQGLKGMILDLRFNSGGLLDSAVDVADKFIEKGLIVKTQPRYIPTYKTANKKGTHPDYPLVILVNRYSASASEIVAGALQDKAYKRAVLVGERTHGKGSVQGITSYPGGDAQLKYTMAYYHLPSGQRVKSQDEEKKHGGKDWGVGPNVEVKLRNDEMRTMIDVQKENDVLVKAGHDNGRSPMKKYSLDQTLQADPQLAVGLLIVKAKEIEQQRQNARKTSAKL